MLVARWRLLAGRLWRTRIVSAATLLRRHGEVVARRWAYLGGFRVLRAVARPPAAVIGGFGASATATGRRASRGECDGEGLAGRPLSASKSSNASTARFSAHPPTADTDTRSSQPAAASPV